MKNSFCYIISSVLISLLLISCTGGTSSNSSSGKCQFSDDIASDGSRCGGRAASVRPGGN